MLVSPAEPASLRSLGVVSSVPERLGADFLFASPMFGSVGVQRKEINDLVASAYDGRLSREFAQMKQLGLGVLLIEGRPRWTDDGSLLGKHSRWTIDQHLATKWSARLSGLWIDTTESMAETCAWLLKFGKWTAKSRHKGIVGRPGPGKSVWGSRENRDWGVHLLQGFEGIGAETAGNIYDHFDGPPLQWTVDERQLQEVKGVGKGRAKKLIAALPDRTFEYVEIPREG